MDTPEKTGMSRREALGMVGAGVAASTAGYVQAQSSTATQTQCAHAMEDPREKYPKPPFKSEEQPGRSHFGLGLWIVRQALDAMGGKISISSQLGAGSTFIVELPRN